MVNLVRQKKLLKILSKLHVELMKYLILFPKNYFHGHQTWYNEKIVKYIWLNYLV